MRASRSSRCAGANWWSLQPIRSVVVPAPERPWVKNAIDSFIVAGHRASGLAAAPEADRRTLIRPLRLT